jgi:hypothetical protein
MPGYDEKGIGPIALMTDFGSRAPFAGTMKGVIASINPQATIIDLTHDISPYNILYGALVLQSSFGYFPEGTIFVAVVDPTVGSERKGLLVEAGGYYFVGPDNGIFQPALEEIPPQRIFLLENERYFLKNVSNTFHGRDVFAPAAAWLSKGTDCALFGPPAEDMVDLRIPQATVSGDHMIAGEVLFSDRFGNLTTNIRWDMLEQVKSSSKGTIPSISVRKMRIKGITTHYAEGKEPSALINSWGYL